MLPTVSTIPFFDPMFYLFKTTDSKDSSGRYVVTTDIVWQYDNEDDAHDAADQYNSNLSNAGIPSWVCCYHVGSYFPFPFFVAMKTIYVQVAVRIADDVDPFETIAECDYQFSGDGILSHEIVHVEADAVSLY